MPDKTLAERFALMLKELDITKAAFARAVGVTPNYIYLLTSGKTKSCSKTLALLIEQKYGYAAEWILHGKLAQRGLSQTVADRMKDLDEEKLKKISAYLDTLGDGEGR